MHIHVYFLPSEIKDINHLKNTTVIVIDVLRAASSMLTALKNGCIDITPAAEVSETLIIAEQMEKGRFLLCGERQGRKINGFDLGNSPAEYKNEVVSGKRLIFTTTNGTRALVLSKDAKAVFILSFLNLKSVGSHLLQNEHNISIICSGQDGQFSLEDTVCAGLFVDWLAQNAEKKVILSDNANKAKSLAKKHERDLLAMLKQSEHGAHLERLGFAEDLELCAKINTIDLAPVYKNGRIRLN